MQGEARGMRAFIEVQGEEMINGDSSNSNDEIRWLIVKFLEIKTVFSASPKCRHGFVCILRDSNLVIDVSDFLRSVLITVELASAERNVRENKNRSPRVERRVSL